MNLNFTPATPADLELLVGFMRVFYELEHIRFDEPVARAALTELLTDERLGRVWLIAAAGEPAGYIVLTYGFSLEYHGRDALLDELFIVERWRGRGIGRHALEFLTGFCRAEGLRAVHLAVDHMNEHAAHVYRQFGFKSQERHLMTKWLDRVE